MTVHEDAVCSLLRQMRNISTVSLGGQSADKPPSQVLLASQPKKKTVRSKPCSCLFSFIEHAFVEYLCKPVDPQVPVSKTCHGPCGLSESLESDSMSVGFFRRDRIPRPARSSSSR